MDDDFKLTGASYNCEMLLGKPWYEFLRSDISAAKAIVFIGFSMKSDLDISRLFYDSEKKEPENELYSGYNLQDSIKRLEACDFRPKNEFRNREFPADEKSAEIVSLMEKGMKENAIASKLHISRERVRRFFNP